MTPIFYASLKSASNTAETGQALTAKNVTYETVDGIDCVYFNGNGCEISFSDAGLPAGNSPRSISFWCKNAGNTSEGMLFGYGTQSPSKMVNIALHGDGSVTNSIYADDSNMVRVYPDTDRWFHVVLTYDGTTETMYLNGVAGSTTSKTFNTQLSKGWMGHYGSQNYCAKAYLANIRVYDHVISDGQIKRLAGELKNAPIFYAPLATASSTAETGQTLTTYGNVTYNTVDGIPCAYFDGSSGLSSPETGLPDRSNPVSISIWANQKQIQSGYRQLITYGTWAANSAVALCYVDGVISYGFHTYDCTPFDNSDVGKWHHFLLTSNGEQNQFYIDGNFAGEWTHQRNTVPEQITIGRRDNTDTYFHGFIAGCRIYDRVVTAGEIQQLAGEFDV
ncbi:MAG: LamG domain-containing protein [Lentisphaeria bacterium]|nr:LamG domain-containing protein [Lentisphaeria bacterium]